VTGEGLNDLDALKLANVSFCMGSGAEITKDASHIIFMDDNFNSIFRATLWGRNILDNIRKFLQFQLCINMVCLFIVLLGSATMGNSPFSVIQLPWINLIMDTLAAIAIATEPPSDDVNGKEERNKGDRIIRPVMWRNISV